MTNPTNIERVVMRRVRRVRVLRVLFSDTVLATVAATAALYAIGREVWVAKVFENGPQDLIGHAAYLFYAFLHTHLSVELLVLTTLVTITILAHKTARVFVSFFTPTRA